MDFIPLPLRAVKGDLRRPHDTPASDTEVTAELGALLALDELDQWSQTQLAKRFRCGKRRLLNCAQILVDQFETMDSPLTDRWRTTLLEKFPSLDSSSGPVVDQSRTNRGPRARSSLREEKRETKKEISTQDTPASGRDPVGLSDRLVENLKAAGLDTLTAVSRKTRKQVLALPGIGPSAVAQIQQALTANGLDFTPEPEKPKRDISNAKAVTDIWSEEYGADYPWVDYFRRQVPVAESIYAAARGDLERIRAGFRRYMDAAEAGEAYPEGPPTLEGFKVRAATWLQDRQPKAPKPEPTPDKPARKAATFWDLGKGAFNCNGTYMWVDEIEALWAAGERDKIPNWLADQLGLRTLEVVPSRLEEGA